MRPSESRPYGCGIAVHSQFLVVTVLVPQNPGNQLFRAQAEFLCSIAEIKRAKQWVETQLRLAGLAVEGDSLLYAIASTSTYHYPVVRTWAGRPCIVNPGLAASFKARKTDQLDSETLAYQALTGRWQPSSIPDERTELLRVFRRTRRRLVRLTTRAHNSIGTRLTQWYCPLRGESPKKTTIRAIIADLHGGQYAAGHPAFEQSHVVPPVLWDVLLRQYAQVDLLKAQIKWLEQQAESVADPQLMNRLVTIPGVGRLTALTWCAEMEPCSRFPHSRHAVAFAGFDPTPQVSAGRVTSVKCRLGNSHIRSALVQAAQVALNGKSSIARRIRQMTKHRNVLIAITGRRITQIA
jgi:transposase